MKQYILFFRPVHVWELGKWLSTAQRHIFIVLPSTTLFLLIVHIFSALNDWGKKKKKNFLSICVSFFSTHYSPQLILPFLLCTLYANPFITFSVSLVSKEQTIYQGENLFSVTPMLIWSKILKLRTEFGPLCWRTYSRLLLLGELVLEVFKSSRKIRYCSLYAVWTSQQYR